LPSIPETPSAAAASSGGANRTEDVALVGTALTQAGYENKQANKSQPASQYGARLDQAVRTFQRDNNLSADGLLKPAGPTVTKLAGLFFQNAPQPRRPTLRHQPVMKNLSADAFTANRRRT